MNIHPIAMCTISMDLSQRALQTKISLFQIFKFRQKSKNFDRKSKNIQKNCEA